MQIPLMIRLVTLVQRGVGVVQPGGGSAYLIIIDQRGTLVVSLPTKVIIRDVASITPSLRLV